MEHAPSSEGSLCPQLTNFSPSNPACASSASRLSSSNVGDGDRSLEASLFALTVMSGRTEAVDWAADFVTKSVTGRGQVTLVFQITAACQTLLPELYRCPPSVCS